MSHPSDAAAEPTPVVLAVDTAFALAREPFLPIGERLVTCPVNGQSEGLSFLLDLLGWYGLTASFFVEVGQLRRYGDAPMGRAVERIYETEQDVQLLVDPRWADGPADQRLYESLIAEGLAAMARWGVPRPVAARRHDGAGDPAFFRAMAACGLAVSCTDGAGTEADRPGDLAGGPQPKGPVTDYPGLSIAGRGWLQRGRRRRLTASGVSAGRLQALLRRARAAGIAPVVIGLATHDFVIGADPDLRSLRPNRGAQTRLERLGDFLGEHPDEFRTVGIAEVRQRGIAAAGRP